MQRKRKDIQEYLAKNVNIFIQPLIFQIVKKKPENPALFSQHWMQDYIEKNTKIGQEISEPEPNTEYQEEIILGQEMMKKKKQKDKRTRRGISEEVFGSYNPKEVKKLRSIPKDEDVKKMILGLMRNSILFQNLCEKDQNIVIQAMEEQAVVEGDKIISEGDRGDSLYIVAEGDFDCFKFIDGEDKYLKTYVKGDAFGELALMYNAPRAATIISKGPGKMYALDRITFSQIVKAAAVRKRELYQNVMAKVEIFSELNTVEKEQFYDILREEKFEPNEYVINQGENGNEFYIVVEGNLIAEKTQNKDEKPHTGLEYKQGDYFGQLALLHDIPRQASVKTLTNVVVAKIEREAFMRILGSLSDILKRNQDRYQDYSQSIPV